MPGVFILKTLDIEFSVRTCRFLLGIELTSLCPFFQIARNDFLHSRRRPCDGRWAKATAYGYSSNSSSRSKHCGIREYLNFIGINRRKTCPSTKYCWTVIEYPFICVAHVVQSVARSFARSGRTSRGVVLAGRCVLNITFFCFHHRSFLYTVRTL